MARSAKYQRIYLVRLLFGEILFQFLGTFAKLRKSTIGFVISVRLPVRPSAWNSSDPLPPPPLDGFS